MLSVKMADRPTIFEILNKEYVYVSWRAMLVVLPTCSSSKWFLFCDFLVIVMQYLTL
jgi:hypothetical protein